MTQPNPNTSPTITTQRAWSQLMQTMGGTNLKRAGDARKAANALARYWGRF